MGPFLVQHVLVRLCVMRFFFFVLIDDENLKVYKFYFLVRNKIEH